MGLFAHFGFGALVGLGLSPSLAVLADIAAAAVLYGILVLALRMVTREDLLLMPKGEKIARWLRIR